MARPAKSINVTSKHITKAEAEARKKAEGRLSSSRAPEPPEYLSDNQRAIFKTVCSELDESKILCSLDNFVLAAFAVAVDRLSAIEDNINQTPNSMLNKSIMSAKDKYTKDFFRCCSELCLSPQSRAKMAIANVNAAKEAEDPLLEALAALND